MNGAGGGGTGERGGKREREIESEVTTFLSNLGMTLEPAIREHMGKV